MKMKLKRLTITLDPEMETWNMDRWHPNLQSQGCREHLGVVFLAIGAIFNNLLHDTPCEMLVGTYGLEEVLTGGEGSRREQIRERIVACNRMVAFVERHISSLWIEITFYEGKRNKCSFSISYDLVGRRFRCMF